MAKQRKINVADVQHTTAHAFPVPLSIEELRRHILELFLHQMRMLAFMSDAKVAWRIVGQGERAHPYDLVTPDCSAADLVDYAVIKDTQFAQAIERMYEYAYFGREDASGEDMADESIYTWTAAILTDMAFSAFIQEWENYGGDGDESAKKCYAIAELANARRVLEGHDDFFYFRFGSGEEGSAEPGLLTVRQMALLAGMEEMSIRAAASRPGPNKLTVEAPPGGRRTRIRIEVAKEWLTQRNRYVPITRYWANSALDLSKKRFANLADVCDALSQRYRALALDDSTAPKLRKQLKPLGLHESKHEFKPGVRDIDFEREHLKNDESVQHIAGLLQLPADLLSLRVREARANEELARVQQELQGLLSQKDE